MRWGSSPESSLGVINHPIPLIEAAGSRFCLWGGGHPPGSSHTQLCVGQGLGPGFPTAPCWACDEILQSPRLPGMSPALHWRCHCLPSTGLVVPPKMYLTPLGIETALPTAGDPRHSRGATENTGLLSTSEGKALRGWEQITQCEPLGLF